MEEKSSVFIDKYFYINEPAILKISPNPQIKHMIWNLNTGTNDINWLIAKKRK